MVEWFSVYKNNNFGGLLRSMDSNCCHVQSTTVHLPSLPLHHLQDSHSTQWQAITTWRCGLMWGKVTTVSHSILSSIPPPFPQQGTMHTFSSYHPSPFIPLYLSPNSTSYHTISLWYFAPVSDSHSRIWFSEMTEQQGRQANFCAQYVQSTWTVHSTPSG